MPTKGIALSLWYSLRSDKELPAHSMIISLFGFDRSFSDTFAFPGLKMRRKQKSFANSQSKMETIVKMRNVVLPSKTELLFQVFVL